MKTRHQFAFTKPWKYSRNPRNGYSTHISIYTYGTAQTGFKRKSPKVFRNFVVQINKHKQILRVVRNSRDPSAKGAQKSWQCWQIQKGKTEANPNGAEAHFCSYPINIPDYTRGENQRRWKGKPKPCWGKREELSCTLQQEREAQGHPPWKRWCSAAALGSTPMHENKSDQRDCWED